jgi:hypothetical protein
VPESDNGETGDVDSDGARGNATVEEGPADWGNGEMGFQGDAGTGVVCDVRSLDPVEPGSRNEKKLWERECLWWCPRRDARGSGGCSSVEAPPSTMGGGRPPKVKPSPNLFAGLERVGDALGIGTPSVGGTSSVSGLISSSCAPSSAMVLCGSEPGRGKKTERFRECRRECLRAWVDAEGDGGGSGLLDDS